MSTSVYNTMSIAQSFTADSTPFPLQTIDLGQLQSVTGGNGFTDWVSHTAHNALNLGKAAANGVVNTLNWAMPKTLDINAGIVKAHFEPGQIGKPFRDDPLSKIGQYGPRQITSGN